MTDAAASPGPLHLDVPPAVHWIVSRLEKEGYETWTVGGAVRDAILGRPSGDWDLATRAPPEEVRRIFPRTVPVGMEHGTVGVLARDGTMYEVTTFRRDVETFGRHAVVAFADTLDEDLHRRDFTINALAWHPLREALFDPHGGAEDLKRRILRTVGEPADRFAEDYLRVLRALRFAGRFGLEIAPGTWRATKAATAHLGVLSPERVREEVWKVLAQDPTPGRSLELYRRSGALGVLLPELDRVAGDGPEGSPSWARTLAVVAAVPRHRTLLRLTALLGRVGDPGPVPGDPPLPRESGPAPSLERLRGMVRAAAVLTRLRHSNAQVADVAGLVAAGPALPAPDASGEAVRRWLARVEPRRVPDLVRWAVAEVRGREDRAIPGPPVAASWRRIRDELRTGHALTVGDLELDGRDLIRMGLRPGPHFGRILDALLDRVLADPASNRVEVLEPWALELAERLGVGAWDGPRGGSDG
ncbi:MAG TPA: CCA tRNA nucleotidyltransferase [Longimicrobiales bacterium]|nr:CCA tRNA nucleotidyltransferase [Longimicrobiales bacterium]